MCAMSQAPAARRTRVPAEPLRLNRLIRAGAIHSMTGETYRSVGLRGPEIVAVSTDPKALDDLAGAGTIVTDARELTLIPAFGDSHEHLMEARRRRIRGRSSARSIVRRSSVLPYRPMLPEKA